MNGNKADAQFERIKEMVKLSKADCDIERVPGEYDSVHVRFIRRSDGKSFAVPWTGEQLETTSPDDLWREIEIKTQGLVKKPGEH